MFLSTTTICLMISTISITDAYSNVTGKYMYLDDDHLLKGRFLGYNKPKFLTFAATDDDISIEMQLSVPFLTIPVKKSVDSATGLMEKFKPANVNLAAVGLAGMLIVVSSFVLPSIVKLFSFDHVSNGGMFERADDGENIWYYNIANRFEQILESKGVPPVDCFSRIICSLVKKSTHENKEQNSSEKIIDGLASNEWITKMLKDTVYIKAISDGYSGENCSVKYSNCKINQNAVHSFMKTLSSKIFNR